MNLVKTDPRGRRHKTKWLLALAALVPVGVSVAGEVQSVVVPAKAAEAPSAVAQGVATQAAAPGAHLTY